MISFAYDEYELCVDAGENEVPVIVSESPEVFRHLMSDAFRLPSTVSTGKSKNTKTLINL